VAVWREYTVDPQKNLFWIRQVLDNVVHYYNIERRLRIGAGRKVSVINLQTKLVARVTIQTAVWINSANIPTVTPESM